jgi:hypothetical protein
MGYFSELDIERQFPFKEEPMPKPVKKIGKRTKKVEGQFDFNNLGILDGEVAQIPAIRKSFEISGKSKENIINVSDDDLPVGKEFLDQRKVVFLDPTSVFYIKKNILEIGRKGILGDAEKICAKSDEDFVKSLVVVPRDTMHVEFFHKKAYYSHKYIYLTGAILAIPLTENDGNGPEQRYIYVGNFSSDEKIKRKSSIGCKIECIKRDDKKSEERIKVIEDSPYKMPWGTLQIGQNLPAYKGIVSRVKIFATE